MRKWQISFGSIRPIDVSGETACFWLLASGRKRRKDGWDGRFFDTWDEAKAGLIEEAETRLWKAQESVANYERILAETRAIQPEEEAGNA